MEAKAVGGELPWDRPKPDPDDLDLFAELLPVDHAHDDDRLTLARIAARAVLEDPPPVKE